MFGSPMKRSLPGLLAPCVLLLACGAGRTPAEPAQLAASEPPPAVATGASGTTESDGPVAHAVPAAVPAVADPTLEIRLRAEPLERTITPVVEVLGGTARLAKTIGVEREVNGHFQRVTGIASLELRSDCQSRAPDCIEIVAGAELRPPHWTGMLGDAQCICTRCAPAPAGTYRFVLHTCDGAQQVESDPFTVGAR